MKKRRVTLFLTFIIVITLLLVSFTVYITTPSETICIDAGHGGFDGGAVVKNTLEKDITLSASLILGRMLENTGYSVIYTRKTDNSLTNEKVSDMKERLKIINKKSNIIYISIHANKYPSSVVSGAQVFYSNKNSLSKNLSENIQTYLKEEDKTNKRLAKVIKDKYITDNAIIPGCIVELGFMSNENDLKIMTTNKTLEYRCLMIYLGILKYLEYN
ncbi:MAG: N-acetylmuramoyl-L-alanine amidase CwlD [Erysipelotrichaceae bacterium]|nr:N-acetylmuramoyl-L-alanine amidase CwlD [Erysipelotrichaceae bacterium]